MGRAVRRSVGVALGLLVGVGALAMLQHPSLWLVPLFVTAVAGAAVGTLWDDPELATLRPKTMLSGVGVASGSLAALVGAWLALRSLGVLLAVVLAGVWLMLRPSSEELPEDSQVDVTTTPELHVPPSTAGSASLDSAKDREQALRAEMAQLSADELWALWSAAQRARTSDRHGVEDVLRLVTVRSAVLDELERRDPDGFARWLSTMAPADLAAYLERS